MRSRFASLLSAAAVGIAAIGCSSGEGDSAIPTHTFGDGADAELAGELQMRSGCPVVLSDGDASVSVLVLPEEIQATVADDAGDVSFVDEDGDVLASTGDQVSVEGGYSEVETGCDHRSINTPPFIVKSGSFP